MRATRLPPESPGWLYAAIVITLCLALLGGVFGWFMLALYGGEMPDGLAAILATIAGGLVGILIPSGAGPSGRAATRGSSVADSERDA